jgi:hypothetical protein
MCVFFQPNDIKALEEVLVNMISTEAFYCN